MIIKNIHQLISCALQDKEKHRNPEKEKKSSTAAFRTEANLSWFLQLYFYISAGGPRKSDSTISTTCLQTSSMSPTLKAILIQDFGDSQTKPSWTKR
jgi:hypothetical protein